MEMEKKKRAKMVLALGSLYSTKVFREPTRYTLDTGNTAVNKRVPDLIGIQTSGRNRK